MGRKTAALYAALQDADATTGGTGEFSALAINIQSKKAGDCSPAFFDWMFAFTVTSVVKMAYINVRKVIPLFGVFSDSADACVDLTMKIAFD